MSFKRQSYRYPRFIHVCIVRVKVKKHRHKRIHAFKNVTNCCQISKEIFALNETFIIGHLLSSACFFLKIMVSKTIFFLSASMTCRMWQEFTRISQAVETVFLEKHIFCYWWYNGCHMKVGPAKIRCPHLSLLIISCRFLKTTVSECIYLFPAEAVDKDGWPHLKDIRTPRASLSTVDSP